MGLNDTAEQLDVCRQQSLIDEARIRELEQELASAAANLTAAADAIEQLARIAALCDEAERAVPRGAYVHGHVLIDSVRAILGGAAPGVVPPQDGYCVCDDGRPARDCGMRAHREAAGVVPPQTIDRDAVLDAIRECAPAGMELRYDGTEDKYAAAYVAGVHAAHDAAEKAFVRPSEGGPDASS